MAGEMTPQFAAEQALALAAAMVESSPGTPDARAFLEFVVELVSEKPSDMSKIGVWQAANHGSDMIEITAARAVAMGAAYAASSL
jgi:hypothetical protein